MSDSFASGP